jgi:hypothetical protein
MTRADVSESTIEVAFDSAERNAGGDDDLGQIHLLDEAKEEDGALPGRQGGDDLPKESDLLGGDQARLDERVGMRNEGGDLAGVDGLSGGAAPETETMGASVIADEIESDAGEPGGYGTVAAEAGTGVPGAEEGLLGESLGEIDIAKRGEEKTEDAGAMNFDDGCEIVERSGDHGSRGGFCEEVRG